MPLTLLPLPESHIPAFCHIGHYAFREANDSNSFFLYPNGTTAKLQKQLIERHSDAFHNLRNCVFLGIYDVPEQDGAPTSASDLSPDSLVCVARMRLEDPETAKEPEKKITPPEEANAAAYTAFFDMISGVKKELMGSSTYWVLDLLATATKHQGRGAGRMILQWMADRAAKTKAEETGTMGVPCFLEATENGKRLYEKMGYETKRFITLRGSDFGSPADVRLWVMVRPADVSPQTNGSH